MSRCQGCGEEWPEKALHECPECGLLKCPDCYRVEVEELCTDCMADREEIEE